MDETFEESLDETLDETFDEALGESLNEALDVSLDTEDVDIGENSIDISINPENTPSNRASFKTILFTSANIINNIVGAGIITLPHAIKDSGIGMGVIIMAVSCCFCGWTFTIMAMCGEICETTTYEKTVKKLLGKRGFIIIIICTLLYPMICAISYGIVIADNLITFFSFVAPNHPYIQVKAVVLIIPFFFIIFPLTLAKNMKILGKFSTLSILLILFYSGVILKNLSTLPYAIHPLPNTYVFSKITLIKALPVFAFACACHHNVISFYMNMKNRSIETLRVTKNVAFMFSYIVYIIVAVAGFVSFGGQPSDNIFVSYCNNDIMMNITRIVFIITLILTSPLQLFCSKEVILKEIAHKYGNHKYASVITSFILSLMCYIVASSVDNIGLVVELGGAISNVPIVYIFPAACALKVYQNPFHNIDIKKLTAWIILLFGLFMLVVSPAFSLKSYIDGKKFKSTPKYYCIS